MTSLLALAVLTKTHVTDEPVVPTFHQVLFGKVIKGNLQSLKYDDDKAFGLEYFFDPAWLNRIAQVLVGGVASVRHPSAIECRIKVRLMRPGIGHVNFYMKNQATGGFVFCGYQLMSHTYQVLSLQVPGDPQDFVDPVTGQIATRFELWTRGPQTVGRLRRVEIEQVSWMVSD